MYRVAVTCLLLCAVQNAGAIEDPTRPFAHRPVLAVPVRVVPKLRSIIVSPTRRLAVIDDQVLSEGEQAGEIKLLRVDTDAVVVSLGNGEQIRLTLGSNKIHKEMR